MAHPRKRNSKKEIQESAAAHATQFFTDVFNQLLGVTGARDIETGRVRQAKCTSLSQVLKDQRRGQRLRGISQTSLYRLSRAEMSPSIEVVCELAKAFQVSPRVFLPEHVGDQSPTVSQADRPMTAPKSQ